MSDINHVDPDDTIKPLAEDNDPPFSKPSSPSGGSTDKQHTDDDIDQQEAYDVGIGEADDVNDPSKGNAVTGYNPAKDIRRDTEQV